MGKRTIKRKGSVSVKRREGLSISRGFNKKLINEFWGEVHKGGLLKELRNKINKVLRDYDKEVRKEAQKHNSHFASYQYFNTKLSVIKEIKVRLKEVLK